MHGRSLIGPRVDGGFEGPLLTSFLLVRSHGGFEDPLLTSFLLVRSHLLLTSRAVQFSTTLEDLRRGKRLRVHTAPATDCSPSRPSLQYRLH